MKLSKPRKFLNDPSPNCFTIDVNYGLKVCAAKISKNVLGDIIYSCCCFTLINPLRYDLSVVGHMGEFALICISLK